MGSSRAELAAVEQDCQRRACEYSRMKAVALQAAAVLGGPPEVVTGNADVFLEWLWG